VRLQLAKPTEHPTLVGWPFNEPLTTWTLPSMQAVMGLHRHVVRMVETAESAYVVKELPDPLALREYRLLRELADVGLPTADVVGVVTQRPDGQDGLLITQHIHYSLPYRVLLSGRGLQIPYLGERLLDALAGLLVRLHLAGFYWGDCSLSNTLFRRDADALSAYIIDVETAERHAELSTGQRALDLQIATENVAGDLTDLQAGGLLAEGIDPIETALAIETSYNSLWAELTVVEEFNLEETFRVDQRLRRLHDLGFDASELELVSVGDGTCVKLVPRVVEHGFHSARLKTMTGLEAGENQGRRLLHDIRRYSTTLEQRQGKKVREPVAAAHWMDDRFEPTIAAIPADLAGKLEPAELYYQVLEHRWLMSERAGFDVGLSEAVQSYVRDVLSSALDEQLTLPPPLTMELPITLFDSDHNAEHRAADGATDGDTDGVIAEGTG
jgi:tRNA A-37 threonylcarbamoyl transferase component Bud32